MKITLVEYIVNLYEKGVSFSEEIVSGRIGLQWRQGMTCQAFSSFYLLFIF